MNINKISNFLLLLSSFILYSCVFDTMPLGYSVKNCTNDTLLMSVTEADTLGNEMYWYKGFEDSVGNVFPEDTIMFQVHGKKVAVFTCSYILPDSSLTVWPQFNSNDIYYVYTIKWHDVTRYSLEEIRAKKLYNKRAVSKEDFQNRLFEYRYADSDGDN